MSSDAAELKWHLNFGLFSDEIQEICDPRECTSILVGIKHIPSSSKFYCIYLHSASFKMVATNSIFDPTCDLIVFLRRGT